MGSGERGVGSGGWEVGIKMGGIGKKVDMHNGPKTKPEPPTIIILRWRFHIYIVPGNICSVGNMQTYIPKVALVVVTSPSPYI